MEDIPAFGAFDTEARYNALQSRLCAKESRPVIIVTGNCDGDGCKLAEGYIRSVTEAGGAPLVLPPTDDGEAMLAALRRADAVVLSGGGDINPLFYGEQPVPRLGAINGRRDAGELLLARLAYDRQMPVLGICRGMQVLAAALGGTVVQDLETQYEAPGRILKHSQDAARHVPTHTVDLMEGSLISRIFRTTRLYVNSFHHQAVRSAGHRLEASAYAPDGVTEAVESSEHKPLLGVQWHPECFALAGDNSMLPLFEWIVKEAADYRAARRFHERNLTLDTHCDTPSLFSEGASFADRSPRILVDLRKMEEGGLDAVIMAAYLPQGPRDEASLLAATHKADSILARIKAAADKAQGAAFARTPQELHDLKREGKRAIMAGIENGYAIGRDLSNIERYRREGVVYLTLCHNGCNDICDSASATASAPAEEHNGVSAFGEKAIREMNRTGMMVDLSHASEKSFYDALEISRLPAVCSHSSSRSLCGHPRNLTDDQLRALSRKGGVAQVTFYKEFLRSGGEASIIDAVEHIERVAAVAGVEHAGIGSDFDGGGGVPGIASASEMLNLTRLLLRKRFSEKDLALIWGGNFLRVMQQVQDAAADIY